MKIGICDDDQLAQESLKRQLMEYLKEQTAPFSAEIYLFQSGREILSYLEQARLDLLFLDIQLEAENGISLVGEIHKIQADCQIAYCTNYLEYATEVYETEHCYYLLKNEFSDRLPSVFRKVFRQKEQDRTVLPVQVSGVWENLPIREILYIERRGKKTYIFLEKEQMVETADKLEALLSRLPETDFIRCHNSYIIAFEKIKMYTRMKVVMKNGVSISISRPYIRPVREGFARWSWERM